MLLAHTLHILLLSSKIKLKTPDKRKKYFPCLIKRTNALEILFHLFFRARIP